MAKKRSATKLKQAVKQLDSGKRELGNRLIERLAFMENTMDELEETIKKDGAVITAKNGNGFDVTSEHPAQKSYNTMVGKYNALVKTILDMIPDGETEGDELLDFLGRGKK